ncbi:sodium:calcium antiporter [archaeon]|nr:MAG: sodium:calcium antiporter [archaeon]
MFFEFFALAISLAALAKSSQLTIKFAERFSILTGIGKVAIGFILIAVATSLPELSIAIFSSIRGEALLSVGNVIGANIMNIAFIMGIASFMAVIRISKSNFNEIVKAVSLLSLLAVPLIFLDAVWWIFGSVCLIAFVFYVKSIMKKEFKRNKNRISGLASIEAVKTLLALLVSVSAVVVFSALVTDFAVSMAKILGVMESLIGATVLALGTTLPELSVAIVAIKRKDIDIVIGDTVGSIITNMTLVLGIASLANPVYLGGIIKYSAAMMIAVNVVFLLLASSGRLGKKSGAVLLALFAAFLISLFFVA